MGSCELSEQERRTRRGGGGGPLNVGRDLTKKRPGNQKAGHGDIFSTSLLPYGGGVLYWTTLVSP